jgi:proton-coupled amino acid transporter
MSPQLLKAFIGTGILFLGRAYVIPFLSTSSSVMINRVCRFANGGMLFSAVTLVLIALISLYSFLLLVDTKMVVPGSFGGSFSVTLLFHND